METLLPPLALSLLRVHKTLSGMKATFSPLLFLQPPLLIVRMVHRPQFVVIHNVTGKCLSGMVELVELNFFFFFCGEECGIVT